jgi:uncharacterized protein YpbB
MAENYQQLTDGLISIAHEKYDNIKLIPVNLEIDGEVKTFELEMYKLFSPVGIKECLQEFVVNMDYAKSANKDGFGDVLEPYLMYLLIKHFTNLGESMPNTFKEQLGSLKHMMNTTAFFQIIIQFDPEEIKKIKEELEILIETFEDNYQILEELKKNAKGKLENPELVE